MYGDSGRILALSRLSRASSGCSALFIFFCVSDSLVELMVASLEGSDIFLVFRYESGRYGNCYRGPEGEMMVEVECGGENFNGSGSRKELHKRSNEILRGDKRPSGFEMRGGGKLGVVSMGLLVGG